MKILTRPLAFIAVITASALLLSAVVVSASVLIAPPVTVSLVAKEDGVKLWLPVPSVWVTSAARMVPIAEALEDLPPDQRRLLTEIDDLLEAIGSAADAELVRVTTDSESVVVAKRNRRLEIHVRSPEGDVDVQVPLRTLRTLVRLAT